jgi:uncharacterized membrane protein (DUF485 family)
MAQWRLLEMDTRQNGTQAQGDTQDAGTKTHVTENMQMQAQCRMEESSKQPATSHKRQDILTTCSIIAVVVGIIMYLMASNAAYVDTNGVLHESFAMIVGAKVLVVVGVAFVIAALVVRHKAGHGDGSQQGE